MLIDYSQQQYWLSVMFSDLVIALLIKAFFLWCRHPRALKSLAKITDTKPVFSANAISLASRQMFVTTLGGGKGYFFSVVLGLQSFSASSAWNARKVSNSQPKPLTIRNFPASSLEHLIFCQPARFLWGTDRVRNRFVGCPWNLWDLFGSPRGTYQSFRNYRGFSIIFPEILDAI